jgi:hypothetical protein
MTDNHYRIKVAGLVHVARTIDGCRFTRVCDARVHNGSVYLTQDLVITCMECFVFEARQRGTLE